MIYGVVEWRFDCDEASESAKEVFSTVMDYGWLQRYGIHPFDTEAIWAELDRQLSQVSKRSPVTRVRLSEGEPTPCWDNFWKSLMTGGGQ